MYFVIIGRQQKLALRELQGFGAYTQISDHIVLVESELDFGRFGGAVKRGKVVAESEVGGELEDVDLVGSADDNLAKMAKRQRGVRRYKTYNILHSDREVREKGVELVELGLEDGVGVVTGWQDIERFETIDFEKPMRGMEIGMMPAKLTQVLLNIGIGQVDSDKSELTVYDPFCGFGTTLFVANSLGYNAIGSDINPALSQQNIKWWPSTSYATDKKMTTFKHDATQEYTKPFLDHVDVIVSEGWLGPVVYENTHPEALEEHTHKVLEVYIGALHAMRARMAAPIIITLPSYSRLPLERVEKNIAHISKFAQVQIEYIGRYARKGQLVQREVLLIQ